MWVTFALRTKRITAIIAEKMLSIQCVAENYGVIEMCFFYIEHPVTYFILDSYMVSTTDL